MQIPKSFLNQWQFPNCVGAIDGKHISIQCPPKTGSQFYSSYKKRFSIILMAACDAKYRFTWMDVGDYGSQNDGGVWANTTFGQAIDVDEIDFPFPKELPGSDVILPFTFVADEAFPLGIHMMRPYARTYRNFGDAERIFNYRLSRARRVIENAFEIMSSRWRILRRDLCCTPETAEHIVKAIVCHHNFLMISEQNLAPLKRIYCPASMLDREGIDGNVIQGN
ncbi:protein ANTAGONIST OF LIKE HETEROCHROMATIN PROTEIN 1-like [Solenopsis invicta]|uniref:protein ANTAGONIST OF LIKE HETEROCHROMATIN PROTEIN 1-like n=1 Tax=Solenopsis invicta TaxID=13686 RepID=UPI00193DF525|nr:protein ANTAGONIST OF LIKE HETEROCHROMATIN PROTEIN 1-like [Solenopsis invicta]